jgi:hypothetical protein
MILWLQFRACVIATPVMPGFMPGIQVLFVRGIKAGTRD